MNVDTAELLQGVRRVVDGECVSKAAELLLDKEMYLVGGAPWFEEIKALLPTLKARVAIAAHTGKRIYGLAELVTVLSKIDAFDIVVGYGFSSPRVAGNIYVSKSRGRVLGIAVVDR